MRIKMIPAVLLLMGASIPVLGSAEAGDLPVVLITAFQPFAGRQVNGSATVAKGMQDRIPGVRVVTEIMPVSWGQPEERLPALVARWKPRLLIGLGEGAAPGVVVESVARNQAAGLDVEGRDQPGGRLLKGGPAERRSTLTFDPTWKLSRVVSVMRGDDAGTYLCNALFYTALAQPVPAVGFVHLPPQGSESEDVYSARLVPIIVSIVQRNLDLPSTPP